MSSITMNLYYTGHSGNAQKFVQEMENSGTAAAIRAEDGNLKYNYFISMMTRRQSFSLTAGRIRLPSMFTMRPL